MRFVAPTRRLTGVSSMYNRQIEPRRTTSGAVKLPASPG